MDAAFAVAESALSTGMHDARDPFIQRLTEPLAKHPERRVAAGTLLAESFDAGHPTVAPATARLERAGPRGLLILRSGLWFVAALALVWPGWWVYSTLKAYGSFTSMQFDPPVPARATSESARLLLGTPSMARGERERLLHLSDPENPAYFAEYGVAHESLPPDFLETARRIDPDNAFFPYLAASRIGADAVEKVRSGSSPQPRFSGSVRLRAWPEETGYAINDDAAFEEAMELLERGTALPRYESHVNRMVDARLSLFDPHGIVELSQAYAHAMGTVSGAMSLRVAADLWSARAWQLSNAGNADEFLRLAEQRDGFLAQLAANPDVTIIGELVHNVVATATAANFHAAAERLGLDEVATAFHDELSGLVAWRDEVEMRNHRAGDEDYQMKKHASFLVGMSHSMLDRQVLSPPPLDPADLKPLRMAEHAMFGAVGIIAVAVALIPGALLVWLLRFAANPVIRAPATRMARLMDWRDWAWVCGLGVVAPVACFLGITWFTPLGGIDYSAIHFFPHLMGVHLVSLLLALLILPVVATCWRLARYLAPFGAGGRVAFAAVPAAALLIAGPLAALPMLGRWHGEQWLASALFAPACWGLFLALVGSFLLLTRGRPVRRMAHAAAITAATLAYPIAIILLCLLLPFNRASEKRWIARDTMLRHTPGADFHETKIAIQLRRELLEAAGRQ